MEESMPFFRALAAGDHPLTFQTFPDTTEARQDRDEKSRLTRIMHGHPTELWPELSRLNAEGAGIFVTVNRMDGRWRGLSHLTGIQGWFVDVDGLPEGEAREHKLDELFAAPLPPSVVVDSRNGLHAYWLAVEGETVDSYREVEEGLIAAFGGDLGAKDAARVLRAPGFLHRKADPYLVTVVHLDSSLRYLAAELAAAYPAPAPKMKVAKSATGPLTELPSTAKLLAVMDYCAGQFQPGRRHELALALAGKLWWWGVPEDEAAQVMRRISEMAGDPDPEDRQAVVRSTYAAGARGDAVSTYELKGLKF